MPIDNRSDNMRLAPTTPIARQEAPTWFVLVVDDEPDIHSVTNMVLEDEFVLGHRLTLLHAHSAQEAINHLNSNPDIALLLLDIVMAKDTDGLEVAAYVRHQYSNPHTRIIVRTGQPGTMQETEIAETYGINYYEPKTQMTAQRLRAVVHMALESYQAYSALESSNNHLRHVLADIELFSHAVAHDIRGPARNLHMLSELLASELPSEASPTTRELAEALQTGSANLLTILEQLLSLSHLGKDSLTLKTYDMSELVSNAIENFRNRATDPDTDISLSGHCRVIADFHAISLVVSNLLDNADKYREPERPLTISIEIRPTETQCVLTISDNGRGIPEEKTEEIFLPFRRACNDKETPGSGIGLALCKRIVDLHEGTIHADSGTHDGTRITLSLPISFDDAVKPSPDLRQDSAPTL